MLKFIKSRRKFVLYYLIVNTIVVTILFMTFSSFPTYDTAVIRKDQPYISTLDTTIEILPEGNTLVTENLTVKGVKSDLFTYTHQFSSRDEEVDEASIKLIDTQHTLTHKYEQKDKIKELELKINEPLKDNEKITIQYKVSGLVKRLRDGQVFQFNPWTSQYVDVANAQFKIQFPKSILDTTKMYNTASVSQQFIKEDKTLMTEVKQATHRGNSYELLVWDNKPFVQKEETLGRAEFINLHEVEEDIQNKIKEVQLDDKKYIMFQFFLRILYIVLNAIITFVFGMFLLTNFIETQSIKKYLRFEFAPSPMGPGSVAKLTQLRGSNLESSIKSGILYMVTKGLVTATREKQTLTLVLKKEVDIDEIDEIVALQKFLFADSNVIYLQKEVTDLEMTSRKTMHFFNYRKVIEKVVHEHHGNKDRVIHKKQSIFWHMKMEFIVVVALLIEFGLFLLLDMSNMQITFSGYIGIELVMVVVALFASGIIPIVYYFSQKRSVNEEHFDVLSEWQYFRTFLFNKKLVREQLQKSDDQWHEFLMYASVFGSEKVVLSALKNSRPEHYNTVMKKGAKVILDTPEGYFTYSVK